MDLTEGFRRFTRDSHYLYYEKNQGGGKPKGIRPYFNLYSAPDRYKNGALDEGIFLRTNFSHPLPLLYNLYVFDLR